MLRLPRQALLSRAALRCSLNLRHFTRTAPHPDPPSAFLPTAAPTTAQRRHSARYDITIPSHDAESTAQHGLGRLKLPLPIALLDGRDKVRSAHLTRGTSGISGIVVTTERQRYTHDVEIVDSRQRDTALAKRSRATPSRDTSSDHQDLGRQDESSPEEQD